LFITSHPHFVFAAIEPPAVIPSHHTKAGLSLGVHQLAIVGLDTYNPAHRNIFLARGCCDEALGLPGVDSASS
jgi:hypothetical protein